MPAKKGAKTNKTAHVLNVLSSHSSESEDPSAGSDASPSSGAGTPVKQNTERPLLPPVLEVARADDEALAQKIQDALALELEEEPPVPSADAPEKPVETEVPPNLASSEPEPAPAALPQNKLPAQETKTTSVEAPPSSAELPGDLVYVNVMQALVEEKAKKYVDMFGLCSCSRCMSDVKALALTNLPPKYMVMHKGEFIPMLTVYENQFSTALTAQIIAACRVVMEHPRHGV